MDREGLQVLKKVILHREKVTAPIKAISRNRMKNISTAAHRSPPTPATDIRHSAWHGGKIDTAAHVMLDLI